MRHADIAIVGGGLAGSIAAAMLGRSGADVVLIDPHEIYPVDFRCEKLDGTQVAILEKTGLLEPVLRAATHDKDSWVSRLGRVVEKRPGDQHGIRYEALVSTIRAEIPGCVSFVQAKAQDIASRDDRQLVTLSNGWQICARLVILANGLNIGIRHKLGMTREVISECHSISIGFDAQPVGRPKFAFPALTHYSESPAQRLPYLTLFPIGTVMRANLFAYRTMDDPWLRELRQSPQQTLFAAMPGLRKLMGDFEVTDRIQIRPVDLYVTKGHIQSGIVLLGDAFGTSCPAAGTGARKALNDVERLCNVHIPQWLATPGMGVDKISAFYDDPVKRACDRTSLAKAFELRSLTVDPALAWTARRLFKFGGQLARGSLRRAQGRFAASLPRRPAANSAPLAARSSR
jgi:2-polyprenyl-6-methoxyphenol hydroxylase-like FAD-dependent oxidoreductase